ncbi:hypothetical protein MKX03_033596 [Papaver bracteatum]|nr:hypothetical protein MKX03_033596 [Papaver bracteatum]
MTKLDFASSVDLFEMIRNLDSTTKRIGVIGSIFTLRKEYACVCLKNKGRRSYFCCWCKCTCVILSYPQTRT